MPSVAWRFQPGEIHALRVRVEERNNRSASARVRHQLALTAEKMVGPRGLTDRLVYLAAEIGLTHDALHRTLSFLEKSGAVERKGSDFALKKSPGL